MVFSPITMVLRKVAAIWMPMQHSLDGIRSLQRSPRSQTNSGLADGCGRHDNASLTRLYPSLRIQEKAKCIFAFLMILMNVFVSSQSFFPANKAERRTRTASLGRSRVVVELTPLLCRLRMTSSPTLHRCHPCLPADVVNVHVFLLPAQQCSLLGNCASTFSLLGFRLRSCHLQVDKQQQQQQQQDNLLNTCSNVLQPPSCVITEFKPGHQDSG